MVVKATVAVVAALISLTTAHTDDFGGSTKSFAGWSQAELDEKWGMDVRSLYNIRDLTELRHFSGASQASQHSLICIMNDVCSIQRTPHPAHLLVHTFAHSSADLIQGHSSLLSNMDNGFQSSHQDQYVHCSRRLMASLSTMCRACEATCSHQAC